MSLTDSILGLLGSDSNLGSIAGLLNASGDDTQSALSGTIPAVLGSLADRATDRGGADAVLHMVNSADDGILSNIGGFLTNRSTDGDAGMMSGIFGGDSEGATQNLAGNLGLSSGMVGKLLPMLAPLVLGFIKRKSNVDGLDSKGILGMLATEKTELAGKGLLGGLGAKGLGAAAAGAAGLGAVGAAGTGALSGASSAVTGAAGKVGGTAKGVAGGVTGGVANAGRDIKGAAAANVPNPKGGLPKWLVPLLFVVGAIILIPLLLSQCSSSSDDDASTATTTATTEAVSEAPDLNASLGTALDGLGIAGIAGSVDGDTATLTGTAASEDDKAAAEAAALSVDGINTVVNDITVEAASTTGDLTASLTDALGATGIAGISGDVDGDTATIAGTVATEDDKAAAEAAALSVDGISTVVNRIVVEAPAADLTAGLTDALGATGIAGISGSVEGDIATLTGTVATEDDKAAAEAAALAVDGINTVVNDITVGEAPTLNTELGIENINFEVGSATITADSKVELQKAIDFMNANADTRVKIDGHTDSDGGEAGNLTLSQDRADSVKAFLVENGIAADRMETEGFGESDPVAANDTSANKALNRRIEFSVL